MTILRTRGEVAHLVKLWHNDGQSVALASGAFDLLHAGHISFLEGLWHFTDRLVVAVTADSVVARKGVGRPIIPEAQRLAVVSALRCTDAAFLFSEIGDDTNLEIIKPDLFGRGEGYTLDMTEAATIARLGIKVELIHTPRITSTTEIIDRIRHPHL